MSRVTKLSPQSFARLEKVRRAGELRLRGLEEWEIAKELNVTQAAVSKYLATCRKIALDAIAEDPGGQLLAQEVATLTMLQREALAAWERSKAPRQKKTTKQVTGGKDGGRSEAGGTVEGRDGNPAFIGEARACAMDRAKLEGLLKEIVEHGGVIQYEDVSDLRSLPREELVRRYREALRAAPEKK